MFCVYVGVDQYKDKRWPKSAGCSKDVDKLSQLFEENYGFSTASKLITEKATRTAIQNEIKTRAESVGRNGVLILFFAMHGHVLDLGEKLGKHGYFIPYDADIDPKSRRKEEWDDKAVSMRWVLDTTRNCPAKHVLIIADTCCSGYLTGRGDLSSEPSLRMLLTNRSRRVIAATSATQSAYGGSEGGIFTKQLIAKLKSDEARSVLDIFVDVRKIVVKDSHEAMLPQCESFAPGDGEFVLFRARRKATSRFSAVWSKAKAGKRPRPCGPRPGHV